MDLARELKKKRTKKTMEHESDGDTDCRFSTWKKDGLGWKSEKQSSQSRPQQC